MKITPAWVLLLLLPAAMAQYTEPWCANRELRMQEASLLHDQLSAMEKQVPVLSPAEQKWLDGELSSGNGHFTPRVMKAMDSREYDISTAKSRFIPILMNLGVLSKTKVGCKDEVLLWTEVASNLPDNELWQSVDSLIKRKLISEESAHAFGSSFLAGNAALRSQAILNGVVIPYLKGTLNCQ